jgi:ABC-type transport system involved in multi-copper enzyme maturation permease subunit
VSVASRALRAAPSTWHVIQSIAAREIGIARRRRLVKLLFLGSILPPIVLAIVLVVRIAVEQMGLDLDWDPVLITLQIQAFPVALLALSLGTPSVSRDRSEDVLFLYATRPVTPSSYAVGKMLAVGVTAGALLVVPAVLLAVLRQGVLGDRASTPESLLIIGKVALAAIAMAWGYAGVSVGPSAVTKRGRWALLLAIAIFIVPDAIAAIFMADPLPIGPGEAVEAVLAALFDGDDIAAGWVGATMLALYGVLGWAVTRWQVAKEMTP